MRKGKRIFITIIAFLLVFAAAAPLALAISQESTLQQNLFFALSLQPQISPQLTPKQYTDVTWDNPTISNVNVSQNLNITLNGNLTIEGGELRLRHCILNVNNGTSQVEYGINVTTGGKLYINESSTITAINTANTYFFVVQSGTTFQMNDSRVEYCGNATGSYLENKHGLTVRADNVWIENNTITNCYRGLVLIESDDGTIINNEVKDNSYLGLHIRESYYNNFTGNTVKNNYYAGFWVDRSDENIFTSNTVEETTVYGGFYLYPEANNNTLSNNTITNNNVGVRMWVSANNTIINNNITGSDSYGFELLIGTDNNTFRGNIIDGGYAGFYVKNSTYNNFTSNTVMNINGFSSFGLNDSNYNNLTGNEVINSNKYGFYLDNSSYNTIFNNIAINSTSYGYNWTTGDSINNDFTDSVEANFLIVNVTDSGGQPLPGTDVQILTNGTKVYATPHFGGLDPRTGSNGLTPLIPVPYRTFTGNDTMTENTNNGTVWYSTVWLIASFQDNPRPLDMLTSHQENFTVTSWQASPLQTMLPLMLLAGTQGGVSPLIYIAGIAVVIALIAVVLFYYFGKGKTG